MGVRPVSLEQLFTISGDIAQPCNETEVVYFRSTTPVTMVINVFNASSSCIMTATLKDKKGNILISDTINHRVSVTDPGSDPPGLLDVVNQQKTLAATGVSFLTISCICDSTITDCSMTTECSGRYEGQVILGTVKTK
jgi:hypothetical protein